MHLCKQPAFVGWVQSPALKPQAEAWGLLISLLFAGKGSGGSGYAVAVETGKSRQVDFFA